MAGDAYDKAFFTNTDTNEVFYVQFNPKEFKLDEKATWKASDEQEATKPLLTYEKGEPTTVSMDLAFDSTDTGANVYDDYVIPLRDFLDERRVGRGQGQEARGSAEEDAASAVLQVHLGLVRVRLRDRQGELHLPDVQAGRHAPPREGQRRVEGERPQPDEQRRAARHPDRRRLDS